MNEQVGQSGVSEEECWGSKVGCLCCYQRMSLTSKEPLLHFGFEKMNEPGEDGSKFGLGESSWLPSTQPQRSPDQSCCHSELFQLLFIYSLIQLHLLGDMGIR